MEQALLIPYIIPNNSIFHVNMLKHRNHLFPWIPSLFRYKLLIPVLTDIDTYHRFCISATLSYLNQLRSRASLSWKLLAVDARPVIVVLHRRASFCCSNPKAAQVKCYSVGMTKTLLKSPGGIKTVKELMIEEFRTEKNEKEELNTNSVHLKWTLSKLVIFFFYRKRNNLST